MGADQKGLNYDNSTCLFSCLSFFSSLFTFLPHLLLFLS